MTKLTAMKTIEFEEELTKEQIIDKMKELLRSNFNRVRIKKRKNKPSRLRCFIKTPLSNPIVSLSGKVDIQVKANKARISIIVKPEPNMWFWFEACFIPFTAGIMIIIMIYQWTKQIEASQEALNETLERLEFENQTL